MAWLPKVGNDATQASNRRPFSLADPAAKAYYTSIKQHAHSHKGDFPPSTIGGVKNRSTLNALLTVDELTTRARKAGENILIYYGDLSLALDLLTRSSMFASAQTQLGDT